MRMRKMDKRRIRMNSVCDAVTAARTIILFGHFENGYPIKNVINFKLIPFVSINFYFICPFDVRRNRTFQFEMRNGQWTMDMLACARMRRTIAGSKNEN